VFIHYKIDLLNYNAVNILLFYKNINIIKIENLLCPITCGVLEDPICIPCCGRLVSREPFILCFNSNDKKCVVYEKKLSEYNFVPNTTPKCINPSYIINNLDNNDTK